MTMISVRQDPSKPKPIPMSSLTIGQAGKIVDTEKGGEYVGEVVLRTYDRLVLINRPRISWDRVDDVSILVVPVDELNVTFSCK